MWCLSKGTGSLQRGSLRFGIASLQQILPFRAGLGLSTAIAWPLESERAMDRSGAPGDVRTIARDGLLMDERG